MQGATYCGAQPVHRQGRLTIDFLDRVWGTRRRSESRADPRAPCPLQCWLKPLTSWPVFKADAPPASISSSPGARFSFLRARRHYSVSGSCSTSMPICRWTLRMPRLSRWPRSSIAPPCSRRIVRISQPTESEAGSPFVSCRATECPERSSRVRQCRRVDGCGEASYSPSSLCPLRKRDARSSSKGIAAEALQDRSRPQRRSSRRGIGAIRARRVSPAPASASRCRCPARTRYDR